MIIKKSFNAIVAIFMEKGIKVSKLTGCYRIVIEGKVTIFGDTYRSLYIAYLAHINKKKKIMSNTEILYSPNTWFTIYNQFKHSSSCNPNFALKNNALILWHEHLNYSDRRRLFFLNLFSPIVKQDFNFNQTRNAFLWYMKLQCLKSLKALN